MKNLIINVEGKVQGVWFRANTKKIADRLNLNGFVRNESDGSVYIELTGDDQHVMKFIEWTLQGPELSVVEKVSIIKSKFVHESGFIIK
jgi:acylphosphatase